jgi:indolepyruvate ferredoxin oxidoreductase alpha subunit
LGNEAVARGAYEAGVTVSSAYPGTPSTEISEYIATYDEIYAEWAPNEKVAAEVAFGASLGGARSICAMKHVGLNVAADPLFTASYTGVNGGLVICVADDMGMHSSQNEQDSRHYAKSSKTLMLEPADSADCKNFVKLAYELSEEFDTPVLLRLSTRVSHSRSMTEVSERENIPVKEYKKDIAKYVMMPAMARGRHVFVEKRIENLKKWAEETEINRVIPCDALLGYEESGMSASGGEGLKLAGGKIGVISAGIAYQYAKEALGGKASYLKLGCVYPLPEKKIRDFVNSVDICYVIEELDPVIEDFCKTLGLKVIGKEKFSLLGEYTAEMIAKVVLGKEREVYETAKDVPQRPPVMCAGCPHRGLFYVLKQLKLNVMGDIGCYTLGALPPLSAMDTTLCMGAGIGMAHGMEKASGLLARKTVAVIGDSTFLHSGVTSLMNIVYNKGTSAVIILDNSITGMTGHQDNPATGKTLKGEATYQVNLEKLCEAVGVSRVIVADPFDLEKMREVIKTETEAAEPSVIIARRPCKLLNINYEERYDISAEKCKNCGICMNLGCPAISRPQGKAVIDNGACVGCGLCYRVCKFGAINEISGKKGGN